MADRMAFPNTMKEFIESFSFKDSEEVYTNGAELIPVFRVEQGFEHYAKEIRVKAIDEMLEELQEVIDEHGERYVMMYMKEIAEQMKEGRK